MEISGGEFVKGTCQTMCPEAEMRKRERHNLLHKYEMLQGTESMRRPRVDKNKAVKEYSRPAAGKPDPTPSDLRPAKVLLQCTHYLLDRICGGMTETTDWINIYEFVFDRLRAVRQDMVIQNLGGEDVIDILECCIRFHIYSAYVLCNVPKGTSNYDENINSTHTQECLKRLICLYNLESSRSSNEAEFLGLYLLFNLESTTAIQLAMEHRTRFKENLNFQTALSIACDWINKNFVGVFKKCSKLSVLQLCALHRHFSTIRYEALKVMSSAYSSKNLSYSLKDLTELLKMNSEDDCWSFCEKCGLERKQDKSAVLFNKTTFKSSAGDQVQSHSKFIDQKLQNIDAPSLLKGKKQDEEPDRNTAN